MVVGEQAVQLTSKHSSTMAVVLVSIAAKNHPGKICVRECIID